LTVETSRVDLVPSDESTALRGPFVRLRVADTGTGMDEQIRARMFEPFFTTKSSGEGTGLGLATVLHIVRHFRGQIVVSSEPGSGSTFDIYLPRAEGEAVLPPGPESPTLPRGEETVLLVEDDPAVRGLLVRTLRALGYTVLEAESGDDAIRLARDHAGRIDLLLCDFLVPGTNGEELAREVRRYTPGAKFLYMSGYGEEYLLRRGLERAAFLCKPFAPQTLARRVRELLDQAMPNGVTG
ncbi:MAG: ATP-binding protein, partial [Chloroflexia bacterium]